LPSFNLKKDRATFKQWRDWWNTHIRAHKIHLIEDDEELRELCVTKLVGALSSDTLKWIANHHFSDADWHIPTAFEDHIKESTKPHCDCCGAFYHETTSA
jgi:hypothetical protein